MIEARSEIEKSGGGERGRGNGGEGQKNICSLGTACFCAGIVGCDTGRPRRRRVLIYTASIHPPSPVFRGKSNGKDYECHLEFLRSVKKEGSVWKVLPRSIQILLKKEENDTGFWERLLKDKKLEKTNVKVLCC